MKAKHTKGPWIAHITKHTLEVRAAFGNPPVVSWQGFDESNRSKSEHRANVRLIALAPEMLEYIEMWAHEGDEWAMKIYEKATGVKLVAAVSAPPNSGAQEPPPLVIKTLNGSAVGKE